MAYRNGDETVVIEGRVENSTAKAWLIDTPNARDPIWIPKSQVVSREDLGNGNFEWVITQWIAEKNGLA